MLYTSTRDNTIRVTSSQAIAQGISSDGGLFVPMQLPQLTLQQLQELCALDYIGRAKAILPLFLTDFAPERLAACVDMAYGSNFAHADTAPLVQLDEQQSVLELWHGPTLAFKDMALQLLPHLLTAAAQKTAPDKQIVILVATSGDTGKAALEGFRDVENTKILVFYPHEGVSDMQKLQMVTQEGQNVGVCAVSGNFDDAQTGVKQIFTDPAVGERLAANNMQFSSANSINWGRLVPQIIYYVSAYCDMLNARSVRLGDKVNFVVPTGNFGNILAGYYAKCMGLPVGKLICASNANCVLTEFIETGVYNRKRDFFTTISPSMDILISSNLERLLYAMSGDDAAQVNAWMASLQQTGQYTVSPALREQLADTFAAGYVNDAETRAQIAHTHEKYGYVSDPHTAVAFAVYGDYVNETGDTTPSVIVSTASPYKFPASVLQALQPQAEISADPFEQLQMLQRVTKTSCPVQLTALREKKVRFSGVCTKDSMRAEVFSLLGLA